MIKKLLFLSLLLVLFSGTVLAQGLFPHPVFGKVTIDGKEISGVEISIEHVFSGKTVKTITNRDGDYQFSIPNSFPRWRIDDVIEITACKPELNIECTQSFKLSDGGGDRFDIRIYTDLVAAPLPIQPGDIISTPDKPAVIRTPVGSIDSRSWSDAQAIWWVPGFLIIMLFFSRILAGKKRWNTFWARFKSGRYDKYKKRRR